MEKSASSSCESVSVHVFWGKALTRGPTEGGGCVESTSPGLPTLASLLD